MASNARAVFSQQIDDDGETPMFVIEKNDSLRIRKGQYSIKMSYYNRKVYFHIQNNAKGTSTSIPEEVMLAMAGLGEEITAVRDFVKSLQPPSPPMLRITLPKKRKVTIVESDDNEDGGAF
ncbi:uncharacterized protein LOC128171123 [Crassostrea angulata]|uniref:uncharacterized protein LOC128171123 n=1 Tax=Magallana angulata TaxID=2784310 RepID=UPI0022B120C5|nr:uncharacterized protein LOC128171123 [Crassostrea angulata]